MRKTTPKEIAATQGSFEEICAAILALKDKEDAARFLRELCTPSECVEFAKRWEVVKELLAGKSQRAIARDLRMSLCKITRGTRIARDPRSPFRRSVLKSLLMSRAAIEVLQP